MRQLDKHSLLSVILVTGSWSYLSQTGEQDVDSQSSDSCYLHQIVLNVGQSQQHGDTHQLRLVLKNSITYTTMRLGTGWAKQTGDRQRGTHGQLGEGLRQDGGERVAGARLQRGMLFILQRSV